MSELDSSSTPAPLRFSPASISKVVGWLRVANATLVGATLTLPDVLNPSNPALQGVTANRPTITTASNGVPILNYNGSAFLSHALHAVVNNASGYFGLACWIRSPLSAAARTIYAVQGAAGAASASRCLIQVTAGETVFGRFNTGVASNARQLLTNAAQVGNNVWAFWYFQHLGSLVGDARFTMQKDLATPAATYSPIGTAPEMPATLVTPTGNALIGAQNPSLAAPWTGDIADMYFPNAPLTLEEQTALRLFNAPA